MGLTGELVRSVFSKNRSVGAQDSNVRNLGVDKRRWSSVRSYLCGDEFNSVIAEDDSASMRSSEATVTQPVMEDLKGEEIYGRIQTKDRGEQATEENENLTTISIEEENAAILIQFAFRAFLARHRHGEIKQLDKNSSIEGIENQSGVSVGTSIEVQTGDSEENSRIREEHMAVQNRLQQKARTQVSRLKEDWDDSTVSSNISKLRIQNRLEATTRRERALAYAFSQQLRTCTAKKKSTWSSCTEPNMGWSWLERWMATRPPESCSVDDCLSKRLKSISIDRRSTIAYKKMDVAGEEKESCGSNDVSVGFESVPVSVKSIKDSYRPVKNRLKATRSISRRKTVPSYQYTTQSTKVSKKDLLREAEKDKKQKQMQLRSVGEIKCKDASSQAPSNH